MFNIYYTNIFKTVYRYGCFVICLNNKNHIQKKKTEHGAGVSLFMCKDRNVGNTFWDQEYLYGKFTEKRCSRHFMYVSIIYKEKTYMLFLLKFVTDHSVFIAVSHSAVVH